MIILFDTELCEQNALSGYTFFCRVQVGEKEDGP